MRSTFAETLYGFAQADPRIYVVAADISPAGPMAKFAADSPERFINVGVAEQVMIGMCAGLALKGKPVFSVQHHPEASPGPTDSLYIFDRFAELMDAGKSLGTTARS